MRRLLTTSTGKTLIEKLGRITGTGHTLLKIIREILRYNIIQIDDGVNIGGDIRQTNGVMQEDPILSQQTSEKE